MNTSEQTQQNNPPQMWFEKYRPQTLDEYVCEPQVKRLLKSFLTQQTHMLLHGDAGSGKTTLCNIIVNEIQGDGYDVLRINASDLNNVETVRNSIKRFISTMGWTTNKKIVFLDEFDYMSNESQAILRGYLEQYTNRVIFLMTCNFINKVIEPIQSRCFTKRVFTPDIQLVKEKCIDILNSETIIYDEQDLNLILNVCYPDFRKTINIIQNHCIDGVLEPIDVREFDCPRLSRLQQFCNLMKMIEYNFDCLYQLTENQKNKLFEFMEEGFLLDTPLVGGTS